MSIDSRWNNHSERLINSYTRSKQKHWNVQKQNKDLEEHFFAIRYCDENRNKFPTPQSLNDSLFNEMEQRFGTNRASTGNRTFFFSKLLGFFKTINNSGIYKTDAFTNLIEVEENDTQQRNEIISNQAEKFFYYGGLHALTAKNRDAVSSFEIYPIFFLYELLDKLAESYPFGKISEFEMIYFVIFREKHSEIEECLEDILAYRSSHHRNSSKLEVEQFLKSDLTNSSNSSPPDTRIFALLKLIQFFKVRDKVLYVDTGKQNEMKERLRKFLRLKQNNELIMFDEGDPDKYHNLLHSDKDLFQYLVSESE